MTNSAEITDSRCVPKGSTALGASAWVELSAPTITPDAPPPATKPSAPPAQPSLPPIEPFKRPDTFPKPSTCPPGDPDDPIETCRL